MPNQPHIRVGRSVFIIFLALWSLSAHATSVRQLQLEEIVQSSKLIFVGRVIASDSRWNESKSRISTVVRFQVDRVIKGETKAQEIELMFAGGKVGEVEQRIEAMIYPEVGEQGVYFVADPQHTFTHPLVGWAQGHYKEKLLAGETRMVTANNQIITALQSAEDSQRKSRPLQLSRGHAQGIVTGDAPQDAVTVAEFVQFIDQQVESAIQK